MRTSVLLERLQKPKVWGGNCHCSYGNYPDPVKAQLVIPELGAAGEMTERDGFLSFCPGFTSMLINTL